MKILHIINNLGMGGAEKLVHDMSVIQKAQGDDVKVLVLNSSNEYWQTEIERKGIEVICLTNKIGIYNPLISLLLIPYLRGLDIVHVHLFPAQYWVALAKFLSLNKIKLVTTEHNTNNRRRKYAFLKFVDRLIYRLYSIVVACSEPVLKSFVDYCNVTESTFISNGVDVNCFFEAQPYTKKELLDCDENMFCVVMVSRFIYPKSQKLLIESLKYLNNNVKMVFVGDGVERGNCIEYAKSIGKYEQTSFLGVRHDIPRILKTCDVVALITEFEGLSLSSLEGLSTGKPFIGSDAPGLNDVIRDAGMLVQNDAKEIAKAIKSLEDKTLYNEVSTKCLARSREYDLSIMVDKYYEVYKNSLNS